MRKPKRWVYLFSFLPGWGQLYLGMLNRGLQFMILLFGGLFLAIQTSMDYLLLFAPILVFYSYYDALHHYRIIKEFGEVEDKLVWQWDIFKKQRKMLGLSLIFIGVLAFLRYISWHVVDWINWNFNYYFHFPSHLIEQIFVTVVIIGIGVRLLLGEKKPKKEKDQ